MAKKDYLSIQEEINECVYQGDISALADIARDLLNNGNEEIEKVPNDWLSTGQMIQQLKIGQKAEVVANGYVGGRVYMWESTITGYREIRWEGDNEEKFSIGGNLFNAKWKIIS